MALVQSPDQNGNYNRLQKALTFSKSRLYVLNWESESEVRNVKLKRPSRESEM